MFNVQAASLPYQNIDSSIYEIYMCSIVVQWNTFVWNTFFSSWFSNNSATCDHTTIGRLQTTCRTRDVRAIIATESIPPINIINGNMDIRNLLPYDTYYANEQVLCDMRFWCAQYFTIYARGDVVCRMSTRAKVCVLKNIAFFPHGFFPHS